MRLRFLRALVALILGSWIAPLGAATLRQSTTGNWTVAAFSDDKTNQFSYCAAWTTYNSGVVFGFIVYSDYSWAATFQNPQWKLSAGATYPVALTIDRNAPLNINATAADTTTVGVPLEDSEDLFNKFIHGYRLNLATAGGANFEFILTDTAKVLPQLLVCIRVNEAKVAAASANPFAPSGTTNAQPQPQPAPSPQPQSPQAVNPQVPSAPAALGASPSTDPQAFADVLNQAGVTGYTIMTPDQAKQYSADVVWTQGPDLLGEMLYVDPSKNATVQGIDNALVNSDTQSCNGKGTFATNSTVDATEPKALLLSTMCTSGSKVTYAHYTILIMGNGGFYVLATYDDATDPQVIDTKIRSAVYNILEN
jgi:hypothetical protein